MGLLIWAGILPVCVLVAWLILRRPASSDRRGRARRPRPRAVPPAARMAGGPFISALSHDRSRRAAHAGKSAHWHDEVLWARDRQTRHLLALVCVHFEPAPFDDCSQMPTARHGPVRVPQGPLARRGQAARRGPPRRGRRPQPAVRGGRRHPAPSPPGRLMRASVGHLASIAARVLPTRGSSDLCVDRPAA